MERKFYVYILASQKKGTIYISVTSHLERRMHEHRSEEADGFTGRYGVHRLVRYEVYDDSLTAIAREKSLKKWNRDWKIRLIEEENPDWSDLWETLNQ